MRVDGSELTQSNDLPEVSAAGYVPVTLDQALDTLCTPAEGVDEHCSSLHSRFNQQAINRRLEPLERSTSAWNLLVAQGVGWWRVRRESQPVRFPLIAF
jgi:hypothetical protein